MNKTDALEEATTRLLAALDRFEEALGRRLQNRPDNGDLQGRLQSLSEENERLAARLEAERHRADRCTAANTDVAQRLDTVIDSVKTIIHAN